MLVEMHRKAGCLCSPAKEGKLRCPLIVRSSSEDVITGSMFQVLSGVNSRYWLPQLLNAALGHARFRQQVFRRLKIDLWVNRSPYPKHLLPWREGSTQVDVTIRWENPPTTIFFEMKYGSGLSERTSADDGTSGYPSDQLIRNARVGLLECGYFSGTRLFEMPPRDFILIVISPHAAHDLVARYRDPNQLRSAIPHSDLLSRLPLPPFIGELSYSSLVDVLNQQSRWLTRRERQVVLELCDYLRLKLHQLKITSHAALGQLRKV